MWYKAHLKGFKMVCKKMFWCKENFATLILSKTHSNYELTTLLYPFYNFDIQQTLQNLAKSCKTHKLWATQEKSKVREQKTKNQKGTKFSVFYRYLSPSFPHASARHLLQCVIWFISPPIDLRMRWISSLEGDFKFSKRVPCTGIIAMQFIMSAPHCLGHDL